MSPFVFRTDLNKAPLQLSGSRRNVRKLSEEFFESVHVILNGICLRFGVKRKEQMILGSR
jgi:hypothetical protein